jgi:hypothetical protein
MRWRLDAAVKLAPIQRAISEGFLALESSIAGPKSDGRWRAWRAQGAKGQIHAVHSPSGSVPEAARAVELAAQKAVLPGAVPIDNGP